MKTFKEILPLTQMELKSYLKKYLIEMGYEPIDQNGFLYAKGNIPVLLVAHMDTVHKERIKTLEILPCISKTNTQTKEYTKYSSPEGIGGDDRCGVFIIMNLILGIFYVYGADNNRIICLALWFVIPMLNAILYGIFERFIMEENY